MSSLDDDADTVLDLLPGETRETLVSGPAGPLRVEARNAVV